MKLERISENQIRCTLDKADLKDNQIHLHELAYGSDKAKALFSEMMQKASEELGFEAENIPLMVEAIPISKERLILNITKVEDPEELDARFSNFAKHPIEIHLGEDEDEEDAADGVPLLSFDDLIDSTSSLMDSLRNMMGKELPGKVSKKLERPSEVTNPKTTPESNCVLFRFKTMDDICTISSLTETIYNGANSLYKHPTNGYFYLLASNFSDSQATTKFCNICSEYGELLQSSYATPYYMNEHYKVIMKDNALQTMTTL